MSKLTPQQERDQQLYGVAITDEHGERINPATVRLLAWNHPQHPGLYRITDGAILKGVRTHHRMNLRANMRERDDNTFDYYPIGIGQVA